MHMVRVAWVVILSLLAVTGCDAARDDRAALPAAKASGGSSTNGAARTAPALNRPVAAIQFVKGFKAGAQLAASTHKPMLLFFTAEWCRYCHKMAADAFINPDVCQLADHFICVEIDADAEPEVCSHFAVQGYPTVLFISPTGTPLNRLVGQKPGRQLLSAMQSALQNVARISSDRRLR
jgi:thioredoxin-related protein